MANVKIRKPPVIEVEETDRDCPECGSVVGLERKNFTYFYECDCGVVSYRYHKPGEAMRDFPKFYAHVDFK